VDLNLAGQVAVVTGAGAGIGLAITNALAAEGAHVVAGSRSTETLDGLERVTGVAIDLSPPGAPAQLVQRAIDDHGRLDVLVNNVGAVRLRLDGFLAMSDEDFEWALQLNFFIALRATRAALAHMVDHGGGAIVNVASVNAFYHPDGAVIDYGAAKAALVNLTKALSQEFGPRICGSASTASRRPSRRRPAWIPRRRARPSSRGWAGSPAAASPDPKRSRRSLRCWPRR
jgi:NAD(P)-dependent dehydrogenase (short-subunit alcohol dehydrogenase family)